MDICFYLSYPLVVQLLFPSIIFSSLYCLCFVFRQVSHEEWIAMWDDYAKNAEQPADWHRRYMEFMFDVEDTSGEAPLGLLLFPAVSLS